MSRSTILLLGLFAASAGSPALAQQTNCGWSTAALSFRGSDVEQATCLLRKVEIGGRLAPQSLPESLLRRIGSAYRPSASQLGQALQALPQGLRDQLLQTADRPLSRTAAGQPARYFVIHDTSTPYLRDRPFPEALDDDPSVNRLSGYLGANSKAHYFVNRRGEVGVGHDLSVPWRATKIELDVAGRASRGRFLHIELVQPRRRDPDAGGANNDRLAPEPGFGERQYRTLAALYVLASARGGRWLIPAFHSAVDAGIPGAHDDPQRFDLAIFAREVEAMVPAIPSGAEGSPSGGPVAARPDPVEGEELPAQATARWGDEGERRRWTRLAWDAVGAHGGPLWAPGFLPSDIETYCPGYARQTETNRRLFWVGLMSSLARFESNFDPSVTYTESFPDAQGNRVISRGLLQISIESGNGYGCRITDARQLHDPQVNLSCAVRILARQVPRGGAIARQSGNSWLGAASYWSPFRRPHQRSDLAAWVAQQPYCARL